MMTTPPIVGVPDLLRCACGPSALTCWPSLRLRSTVIARRVPSTAVTMEIAPDSTMIVTVQPSITASWGLAGACADRSSAPGYSLARHPNSSRRPGPQRLRSGAPVTVTALSGLGEPGGDRPGRGEQAQVRLRGRQPPVVVPDGLVAGRGHARRGVDLPDRQVAVRVDPQVDLAVGHALAQVDGPLPVHRGPADQGHLARLHLGPQLGGQLQRGGRRGPRGPATIRR